MQADPEDHSRIRTDRGEGEAPQPMSSATGPVLHDEPVVRSARPAASVEPADIGTRFSAFVIDAAILFGAQWVTFIVLSRQLQAAGMTSTRACGEVLCEGPSNLLWALLLIILVGSTIGYYAILDGRYGATPAKRWLGLEVVDIDTSSPIGFGRGAVRAALRQGFWLSLFFLLEPSPLAVSVAPSVFFGIVVVMVSESVFGALHPSGRALHDYAASSAVVRTADLEQPFRLPPVIEEP